MFNFFILLFSTSLLPSLNEATRVPINSPMPSVINSVKNARKNNESIKKLTFLSSVSYSSDIPLGPLATKAIEQALDQLHGLASWLPNYSVGVEIVDDGCVDSMTIANVIPKFRKGENLSERVALFASHTCEAVGMRTVGEVSKFFNFMVVGF